jgi:hypothetical protein
VKDAIAVLQQLMKDKFWGTVQLDFRDGQINVLRKTETVKLGDRNNLPNELARD